jgi:hypothetical protein
MVDPKQYYLDNSFDDEEGEVLVDQKPSQLPMCSCVRCSAITCERDQPAKFNGYRRIDLKDSSKMDEHQCFLCPFSHWAFVLATRQWSM